MRIEILAEPRLRYWCSRIQFPQEAIPALAQIAQTIQAEPLLLEIFTQFHENVVLRGDWHKEWSKLPVDPRVQERLGEEANLFYLLAYLSAMPVAWEEYQRRGISADIYDATMYDITRYFLHHSNLYNRWTFEQFEWVWRHLNVELFRLGRLQYMLIPFHGGVTGLRHRDGRVVLLADPEMRLRDDGYGYEAGDNPPQGEPWLPVFEHTENGWRGQIVAPLGFVQKEVRSFPKSEWQCILTRGDTVLDIHIPDKDRFTVEDCSASLRQALDFFARTAPDRPIHAGFCHTWFFTPQLQKLLPPESNIVRFQREFSLYPSNGKLSFLWTFAFGERYPDRATAPRDTRLRKAVLEWLDNGGEIFDMPGVFFHQPEEWGSQPYMRAWEAEHPVDPNAARMQ